MTKFKKEEVLMSYDDFGITLTNHRIIYKYKNKSQEFFVKDLVGFKLIYKTSLKYFIPGTIVLLAAFFFLPAKGVTIYVIFLLFIGLYFLTLTKFLKIHGANTNIEFKVQGIKTKDLAELLSLISLAEENINKEST